MATPTDMSPLVRRVTSQLLRVVASPHLRDSLRALRESRRRLMRAPHHIDYFHQVDDPYSHLAAQALAPLCERYDVEIACHLVGLDEGPNLPEPELLQRLAVRDAALVAPHYGLEPPGADEAFLKLAAEHAEPAFDDRAAAVAAGNALRSKLGHYSSATFHYAGEWYWGVDRLHHLEARLRSLGAARPGTEMRFPRPKIPMEPVPRGAELTLEVFPSLRSPYSAIGFAPAVELARRTGVNLVVRPVLPMVMRGVPVTMQKGFYIFRDTVREGETLGMPFGRMLDPIGEPVRRGFALWPFARDAGRGPEYLASFLRAAFAEGRPTWTEAGLKQIVEDAGLAWSDAKPHLGDTDWEAELEENRVAMYEEMGLWGVPSFRLSGPRGEPVLSAWGQDRLWVLGREIQRRGSC